MRRIWLAIRVFFLCLFNRAVAEEVAKVLARMGQHCPNGRRKQNGRRPHPASRPEAGGAKAGRGQAAGPQRCGGAVGRVAAGGTVR